MQRSASRMLSAQPLERYTKCMCMFERRPDSLPISLATSRPHIHEHKYALRTQLRPVILVSEQIRWAAITALDRARGSEQALKSQSTACTA